MAVSKQALDELAITEAEYEAIVERLGREPNHLELGLCSARSGASTAATNTPSHCCDCCPAIAPACL